MIRTMALMAFAAVVLMFAGCAEEDSAKPENGPEEPPLHVDIDFGAPGDPGVLISGFGTALKVFAPQEPASEKSSFSLELLSSPDGAARITYPYGSGYLLRDRERVILVNSNFNPVRTARTGRIGYIKIYYPYIYIASGGGFAVYDQNLQELSRVTFEFPDYYGDSKNAHHIIVRENIAYLLDNIVEPIFVFQVDVENPEDIKTIFEYEFSGINEKLHSQWIDAEAKLWAIRYSSSYMGGSSFMIEQGIHLISLEDDSYRRARVYLEDAGEPDYVEGEMLERYILADAALSPNWLITMDEQNRHHLSTVEWKDDQFVFSDHAVLEFIEPGVQTLITADERFIYLTNGTWLYVLDISGDYELIFEESLDSHGIERVLTLELLEN